MRPAPGNPGWPCGLLPEIIGRSPNPPSSGGAAGEGAKPGAPACPTWAARAAGRSIAPNGAAGWKSGRSTSPPWPCAPCDEKSPIRSISPKPPALAGAAAGAWGAPNPPKGAACLAANEGRSTPPARIGGENEGRSTPPVSTLAGRSTPPPVPSSPNASMAPKPPPISGDPAGAPNGGANGAGAKGAAAGGAAGRGGAANGGAAAGASPPGLATGTLVPHLGHRILRPAAGIRLSSIS